MLFLNPPISVASNRARFRLRDTFPQVDKQFAHKNAMGDDSHLTLWQILLKESLKHEETGRGAWLIKYKNDVSALKPLPLPHLRCWPGGSTARGWAGSLLPPDHPFQTGMTSQ
jgi:hypothetical protein